MPKKIDLSGSWTIRVSQRVKKKSITYNIDCKIAQIENQLVGSFYYNLNEIDYDFESSFKNKRKITLPFKGEIYKNQLQLIYNNTDNKVHQLGSVILNIISDTTMEGLFIGYGPESERLISGKIKFKKV